MPSELQRVARGLVDCFDEIPRVVDHLLRTAARCRENAQVALIASRGQATVAAQQLDAAARACEAAAHFLSMAPPKARNWAEALTGTSGPSTNRPSSDSADRNKLTSGGPAAEIRTKRLVVDYEDVEVAEDNEPPLITVARKAFEKYHKAHENDDETEEREPLELEITVTETGDLTIEERDEKEEEKCAERLTGDFEIGPELTEAVKDLLESMTESEDQKWQHATLTITADRIEATFDHADEPQFTPIVVDIQLPDLPRPDLDFDPSFDLRPLEFDFAPGVNDPLGVFKPHERVVADRLAEEGWRIDARKPDHGSGQTNPDATVRKRGHERGVIVEFKTPNTNGTNTVKRNICDASSQAGEIVIDGRGIDLSEADASRAYRRALGQPGKTVADVVHLILGDGRLVSYRKEK
ncbi:hypothetical protein [Kribbella shirazensis]|uniref:tRNA nuclease CdiA C-terminal domain-containing protein n=1 Tax=Kribbella shirazensis TaxID=1105143 RepID=A0A7X5VCJ6_9ACTN|nr:hypothetical protein [Kribbella shirazensis]NIK58291.1 hypothetical protein [Kribbella shirazensis]